MKVEGNRDPTRGVGHDSERPLDMFPSVSKLVCIRRFFLQNTTKSGKLFPNYVTTPVGGWRISHLFCFSWTDSAIAPPKASHFFLTNVPWPLDAREDSLEREASIYFLESKGLSIDDVGVLRDTVF